MVLVRRALGTGRAVARMRHQRARALVGRDLRTFLQLECLATLVRSGLADALRTPGTAADLAARAGLSDVELTTALLDTGASFRHVRRRGDVYSARGARLRATTSGAAPDVRGLLEESQAYSGRIYVHLVDHLRGAPPGPYDAGLGDEIARSSRIVEPVVGPWLAAHAARSRAGRVLDVGCGSGVNLRWMAEGLPRATLQGIDLDADAVEGARRNLADWDLQGRVDATVADVRSLPAGLTGPWDLILLAQNIYYWPVGERTGLLRDLRDLLAPSGTLLVLTAVPSRSGIGRHLDLALRVTSGCARLPTLDELRAHATEAGFTDVRARDLVPGVGLAAMVARS